MTLCRLSLSLTIVLAWTAVCSADALDRMRMSNLRATRASLEALRAERSDVDVPASEFRDYRAQIHVHSAFSHDSVAPLDEILAAARTCKAEVLMFSEHPAPEYDFFRDGHQGLQDGILLVPGAEKDGFLLYPTRSIQDESPGSPQELADLVGADDGLTFISHMEERLDWEVGGITGNEIYNTHADAMEERRFLAALRNPLLLLSLLPALQEFPQELFGAIQDYPTDYLRRWDELCQMAPHTGVAANDSHHNQVIRARVDEEQQVVVEDALGKQVASLDPEKVALLKPLVANRQPGDTVLELDLDPYERSFGHVSTHLLMRDLTREEVWDALKSGRAYVGFEWLADPTGFWFEAHQGGWRWPMGSQIAYEPDADAPLQLSAAAPLPALFKLLRDGQVVKEDRGRTFTAEVTQPGVYRLEAWLLVAGELKLWILSNPFYIGDQESEL